MEQLEAANAAPARPPWVPDEAVDACEACQTPFRFTRRRVRIFFNNLGSFSRTALILFSIIVEVLLGFYLYSLA
jgi:hypothetical protein